MSEEKIGRKRDDDWLDEHWLAEQKKNKSVKNLEIIAGTLFIVLLVSALVVLSPYLAIAAVLSLAIPKLGEKLYSTFFSRGDEMNSNSQTTQENQTLANDRELEKADPNNTVKNDNTKYGSLYKRMPEGLLTEQQIVAQGKETDFTTAGKFIKG